MKRANCLTLLIIHPETFPRQPSDDPGFHNLDADYYHAGLGGTNKPYAGNGIGPILFFKSVNETIGNRKSGRHDSRRYDPSSTLSDARFSGLLIVSGGGTVDMG